MPISAMVYKALLRCVKQQNSMQRNAIQCNAIQCNTYTQTFWFSNNADQLKLRELSRVFNPSLHRPLCSFQRMNAMMQCLLSPVVVRFTEVLAVVSRSSYFYGTPRICACHSPIFAKVLNRYSAMSIFTCAILKHSFIFRIFLLLHSLNY